MKKHIETHGVITMLVKMAQEGYLKLIFTNNLWAKYAFNLTDEELQKVFWNLNAEDLILLRAKIAVAKFFTNDQELLMKLFTLFQTRLMSDQGLWDIANIFGKQVDEKKLNLLLKEVASGKQPNIYKSLSRWKTYSCTILWDIKTTNDTSSQRTSWINTHSALSK